ncbi:MAG: hypothetical protein GC159_10430 [Phycisphaera sp.]|nr:hypothetical protein [Phycisphaera sp.]
MMRIRTTAPIRHPHARPAAPRGRLAVICLALLAAAALLAPTPGRADDQPNDRYWALYANHSIKTAREVSDWNNENGNPHVAGQRLFDQNNPALLLRDTTVNVHRHGAFIQLANGDVLPGRVVRGESADPNTGAPERLIIAVQSPLGTQDDVASELPIRPDHCARIVFNGDAEGPLEPGTLLYNDGRRVKVQQIKWSKSGIKALTESTTIRATWNELSEVHPPGVDAINAVLDDSVAPCPDPNSGIGRMTTSNGGVLTYRMNMLRINRHRWRNHDVLFHTIQPAWALASLRIPFDEVASISFRRADELPLSVLPCETLEQRSFTGFTWPWRRNTNVRGGTLTVGNVIADLGLGTHSHSALAFDLPPRAERFYSWIGIDHAVGNGGCVRCSIYADSPGGRRLWQSDFLRGGNGPVHVDPIDLNGVKRLVLVTEFGHENRPAGADPVDIRDEVDWLWPTIDINLTETRKDPKLQADIRDVNPIYGAWDFDKKVRESMGVLPYWDRKLETWRWSVTPNPDQQQIKNVPAYRLTRRIRVAPENAWVYISAARDDHGDAGHEINVLANGEPVKSMDGNNINTQRGPGDFDTAYWSLGAYAGQSIELAIEVKPRGNENQRPAGLIWGRVEVGPIVTDLPPDGQVIRPDVPLASVKPAETAIGKEGKDAQLTDGKFGKDPKPLDVVDYPFVHGYAVPIDTTLTYNLDPSWRAFVAVLGITYGSNAIGPYEVYLDDQLVFHSGERVPKTNRQRKLDEKEGVKDDDDTMWTGGTFSRHTPGRQIRVDIPPGHKTIRLVLAKKGSGSWGAWAEAGFMKQ